MPVSELPEGATVIYIYAPYSDILTLAITIISAIILFRFVVRLLDLGNFFT